jgi:hypothetical protein
MRGGHIAVGVQHDRVCVVEATDPTPQDQISWWKVVRTPNRPFGQKTNLLSQHHQGFGIACNHQESKRVFQKEKVSGSLIIIS